MEENTILVLDDEETIRDLLEQAFSREGFRVLSAESAEKALDILRKESIMVMFLDLKLPGMSGLELCENIRKQNQVSVIYALTGYVDLFSLLDCRKAGFDDFFAKPVDLKTLLKAAKEGFERVERWNVGEFGLA